MDRNITSGLPSLEAAGFQVSDISLPELIGEVYLAAPKVEQCQLLEQLLRPLGVLSLVAVANGIFAKIRFRSGWPALHIRIEDAQSVCVTDVVALADHVQQVSVEAFDGLTQILIASPWMASSAAAAVLVTVLVRRARSRRAGDSDAGTLPAISS